MDTRALGGEFFTKGRNPRSRNENSNTIYGSDPPHGSDGGAAVHSKTRQGGSEETAAQIARCLCVIDHLLGGHERGSSSERVLYLSTMCSCRSH